jgi:hypothetical protein
MNRKTHLPNRVEYDSSDWVVSIGGSFIIHVILVIVIYLCSLSYQEPIKPPQAMDVDLATLQPAKAEPPGPVTPEPPPAKPPEPEKPAPEPVKKEIPKPVKEPVKKAVEPEKTPTAKKPDLVLNDKNKPPKKMKETKEAKEPDPQEEISKALKRLEKNTGEPPPEYDPLAERMKKMKDEVKKSGPRPGVVSVNKSGGGPHAAPLQALRLYHQTAHLLGVSHDPAHRAPAPTAATSPVERSRQIELALPARVA